MAIKDTFSTVTSSKGGVLSNKAGGAAAKAAGGGIAGKLAGEAATSLTAAGLGLINEMLFGKSRTDPDVQFCFYIEIDGIQTVKFNECNGIEWTVATESFHEGGNNRSKVNLIGQGSFKPLIIKKGFYAGGGEFFNWLKFQMEPSSPSVRTNISVVCMSEAGDEIGRFNLYNAFCSRYKGPSFNARQSEIAFEEIEFVYDWFDFKAGDLFSQLLDSGLNAALKFI